MPSQSICCAARQGADGPAVSLANLCHRFSRLSRNNPQVVSNARHRQQMFSVPPANAIVRADRRGKRTGQRKPAVGAAVEHATVWRAKLSKRHDNSRFAPATVVRPITFTPAPDDANECNERQRATPTAVLTALEFSDIHFLDCRENKAERCYGGISTALQGWSRMVREVRTLSRPPLGRMK